MTLQQQWHAGMSTSKVDRPAIKQPPSLAKLLSLFIIGAAIVLLTGIGGVVYLGVGTTLTDMQEAAIEHQMDVTKERIDTFLDYYTQALRDKAKFPVLIQGTMQPEIMAARVADFMAGVFLFGHRVQLTLLDYEGRLIHTSQDHPLPVYQGHTWVKNLTDGATTQHTDLHPTESGYFWRIAVPVRYNQEVEGILVAELPFGALEHPFRDSQDLIQGNTRVEFHHKNQLVHAVGPEISTVFQDYQLPALDLVLRFFWDRRAMEQARVALLLKIFAVLALMSVLILTLALFAARRRVARPLEILRDLTHAVATGNRTAQASVSFPLQEVQSLARDFNFMADKIGAREQSLENEVHERKEAETALLKSEQRFRTLVEYAPETIMVLDMEAGHFVDVNANASDLFGYSREALLELGPIDLSPPSQPNGHASSDLALKLIRFAEAGETPTFEWVHLDASGQEIPCEIRLVRLPSAEHTLIRASITDVTARKQADDLRRISDLVFKNSRERISVVSTDYRYQRVSRAYYENFGLKETEIIGLHVKDVLGETAFVTQVKPNLDRCFAGEEVEYERWFYLGQASTPPRYLIASYSPLFNEKQIVLGALAIVHDITERKRAEELLFKEKERAQVTLHSIGDAVISTDAKGHIDFLNPIVEVLTGWTEEEAKDRPLADVFCIINEETREPTEDPAARCLKEGKVVGLANHTILVSRLGREHAIEDSAAPITSEKGEILGIVLVFKDVTEARRLSRAVSYQAAHDALTGLINRAEFDRRLRRVLDTAQTDATENAFAYLDLDQFKLVNDTCGHVAGDELLRQIGQLLTHHIRKRDTLARLGGDEFGLLMEHCTLEEAQGVSENLVKAVSDFIFPWEEHSFNVGVSIGLVSVDQTSIGIDGVLSAADSACYMAKEQGRNRVHVHQDDDVELAKRHGEMQWAARLPRALKEDRFLAYFQNIAPIDDPGVHHNNHYELLLRMSDEKGNIVQPGTFLGAAERYNLSDKLDCWMINKAFGWLAAHPAHLKQLSICSINLSGLSLSNTKLTQFVIQKLKETDIPPEKICFEITETVAIANLSSATRFITRLTELGCRFALDDFGSGLSSFAYLKHLPVDFLKIDGLFVKDIIDDPMDLAIVKSINDIGHVMGKQTIAEFVESGAILEKLREIGVDYVQGYRIGRPRPLEDGLVLP